MPLARRGFTLIELLVIVAILATMVTLGVGSIRSGQGAARVKGATRDIYAAIRHARSTALVTGQPAIITYSTVEEDGEVLAKVEITSAKLFSSDVDRSKLETLSGEPLKAEGRELVHIEESGASSAAKPAGTSGDAAKKEADGETVEEILFSPMDAEIVTGMRLKVVKDGDEDDSSSDDGGRKPRISVFSNVDYLIGRFKDAKAEAAKKEAAEKGENDASAAKGAASAKPGEGPQEPVSVVWETNGRVDPHKVWVYADGQRPEDGLLIRIDRFGAAKVVSGDGREDGE